jgi:hypothetical protein
MGPRPLCSFQRLLEGRAFAVRHGETKHEMKRHQTDLPKRTRWKRLDFPFRTAVSAPQKAMLNGEARNA